MGFVANTYTDTFGADGTSLMNSVESITVSAGGLDLANSSSGVAATAVLLAAETLSTVLHARLSAIETQLDDLNTNLLIVNTTLNTQWETSHDKMDTLNGIHRDIEVDLEHLVSCTCYPNNTVNSLILTILKHSEESPNDRYQAVLRALGVSGSDVP